MKPIFHCLHGWGFDASFFEPLAAALPECGFFREDLGFWGGRSETGADQTGASAAPAVRFAPEAGARPLVLVGHSMGLALLLELDDLVARASAVVSLCGFPRFCRAPGFKPGLPPRLVKSMLERFAEVPAEVLRDFRARCGLADLRPVELRAEPGFSDAMGVRRQADPDIPEGAGVRSLAESGVPEGADVPRLAQALERLLDIDVRDRLARLNKPLLVLAAEDDLIAPPALSADAFADFGPAATVLAPRSLGGGHVLPLTRPGWCAGRLREFLARTIGEDGKDWRGGKDGFAAP